MRFFRIKFIFYIILFIIFLYSNMHISFAISETSPLVSKLTYAFETIKSWLITLATPAAAVAVGVGVFMKKFSFGDEERIRVAKKLIRGSLFSYAFILAINLVLSTIKSLVE